MGTAQLHLTRQILTVAGKTRRFGLATVALRMWIGNSELSGTEIVRVHDIVINEVLVDISVSPMRTGGTRRWSDYAQL